MSGIVRPFAPTGEWAGGAAAFYPETNEIAKGFEVARSSAITNNTTGR